MSPLVACLLLPILNGGDPPADEILAAVARNAAMRHQAVYSGVRQYSIHNLRFDKSASVKVTITAQPAKGKQFTIVSRSGCGKLIDVVETLISKEADTGRSNETRGHEIGPLNYHASLTGSATIAGRDCWVLALKPKARNKYLIDGTAWVDKGSYALVRLEGTTASRVSMLVGSPHIIEEFGPVAGIWLPIHTISESHSTLLGVSQLDILYTDYDVEPVRNSSIQTHVVHHCR
jgi:hypothetical protein